MRSNSQRQAHSFIVEVYIFKILEQLANIIPKNGAFHLPNHLFLTDNDI